MAIVSSILLGTGYTAEYVRPLVLACGDLSSGSLVVSSQLYKDADARFTQAQPATSDNKEINLTPEERAELYAFVYRVIEAHEIYPNAEIRDPDPEKTVVEEGEEGEP